MMKSKIMDYATTKNHYLTIFLGTPGRSTVKTVKTFRLKSSKSLGKPGSFVVFGIIFVPVATNWVQ